MEAAEKDASLTENIAAASAEVHQVNRVQRGESGSHRSRPGSSASAGHRPDNACQCCGRKGHTISTCLFKNAKCYLCGNTGHLKSVCTKKSNSDKFYSNFKSNRKQHYIDNDSEISSLVSDIDMYNIRSRNGEPIKIKLKIENRNVLMELDTGSAISAISYDTYKRLFAHLQIVKSKVNLRSYTGNPIFPTGYVMVNTMYKNIRSNQKLFVVPNGGPPLLGRKWMEQLKIHVVHDESYRLNHLDDKNSTVA